MDKAFSTVKESKSVNSLKGESYESYRNEKNEEFAIVTAFFSALHVLFFFLQENQSQKILKPY